MSALFSLLRAANRYRGLLRSQYWSGDDLRSYTQSALEETLRAGARIPFYAQRWNGSPRAGDLTNLPPILRRDIASMSESALSLYPPDFAYSSHSSSGSTGMPARFVFDGAHQSGRLAARMRYLSANGWTPLKPTVWLLYHVFRPERNEDEQLMHSRFRMRSHILPASAGLEGEVEKLSKIDPIFLYTFPSYLEILLDRLQETGLKMRSLRKIFTGAEVLEDSLRHRAETGLGVSIAENYGSTEAFLAFECPAGNRHINSEHVIIEIVDEDGRAVEPGQLGKVLVTTIENRLAPLVRYEIGDYAIAAEGKCECGRTLPLIGKIVGRAMNLFRRSAGDLISPWHLSTVVRRRPELKQFQIVQNSIGRFTVRFISDCPLSAEGEEVIRQGFRDNVGEQVTVDFARVRTIPRTIGGKYMTALCELEK